MWEVMGAYGPGWFAVGMLHMIAFWAIVAGLVALLARRPDAANATPLEQLEMRYASGEIDRAEFLQRKKDIEG